LFPVEEGGEGDIPKIHIPLVGLPYFNELLLLSKRQRAEKDSVHNSKDGSIACNPQGQSQNDSQAETGYPAEHTKRKMEVLK
jgi:hypothetical protein